MKNAVSVDVPVEIQVFTDKEKATYRMATAGGNRIPSFGEFKQWHISKTRYLTSYVGNLSILMKKLEVSNSDVALSFISTGCSDEKERIKLNLDGYKGLICSSTSRGVYEIRFFLGRKDLVFELTAIADTSDNSDLKRLMSGILVGGQKIFTGGEPLHLSTQVEDLDQIPDMTFALEHRSDEVASETALDAAMMKTSDFLPLKIVFKPRPQYTEAARRNSVNGIVKVLVTFGPNGAVERVALIGKSLGGGLNEQAVLAARQIRFFPARKENKPISVTKMVEYSFSVF